MATTLIAAAVCIYVINKIAAMRVEARRDRSADEFINQLRRKVMNHDKAT